MLNHPPACHRIPLLILLVPFLAHAQDTPRYPLNLIAPTVEQPVDPGTPIGFYLQHALPNGNYQFRFRRTDVAIPKLKYDST